MSHVSRPPTHPRFFFLVSVWPRLACVWLVTVLALGVMSCSSSSPKPEQGISQKLAIPEYFKYIPADTPYVVAGLKPVPYKELGVDILANYKPMLSAMLGQMRTQMANTPPEYVQSEERLVVALLEELEGNFSQEGIKNLGMTLDGHLALYGIGVLPVVRMELADAAKFEAFLGRLEAKAPKPLEARLIGPEGKIKMRLWQDGGFSVPMIVTDTEFLVGMTPDNFLEEFVAQMIGQQLPETSMFQDNRIAKVQAQQGYLPYSAGYAEISRVMDAVVGLDPTSKAALTLDRIYAQTGGPGPAFSAPCQGELSAIGRGVPRVVFGYNEFSKAGTTATVRLSVTNGLTGRMAVAKSPVPGFAHLQRQEGMLGVGLGVSVGGVIEFLRTEAQRLVDAPFVCPDLQGVNTMVQNMFFATQQVPPFAAGITGLSLLLQELSMDTASFGQGQPPITAILAALVVGNTDPQQLYGAIQAFVPELSQVTLTPSGQPIAFQLPAQGQQFFAPGVSSFVAMSPGAVGIGLGQGADAVLANHVETTTTPTPVVFAHYDVDRFGKFFASMSRGMSAGEQDMVSQILLSSNLMESATVTVDIDDSGVSLVSRGKFKPQVAGAK